MMPANVMMEFAFTIIFSLVSVVGMLLVVVVPKFQYKHPKLILDSALLDSPLFGVLLVGVGCGSFIVR